LLGDAGRKGFALTVGARNEGFWDADLSAARSKTTATQMTIGVRTDLKSKRSRWVLSRKVDEMKCRSRSQRLQ